MLVHLFVSHNADMIHFRVKFFGVTSMHVAAEFGVSTELFDFLLDNGVMPNTVDARGWNVFHYLCEKGELRHEKLLAHILQKLPDDLLRSMISQQVKRVSDTVSYCHVLVSLPFSREYYCSQGLASCCQEEQT